MWKRVKKRNLSPLFSASLWFIYWWRLAGGLEWNESQSLSSLVTLSGNVFSPPIPKLQLNTVNTGYSSLNTPDYSWNHFPATLDWKTVWITQSCSSIGFTFSDYNAEQLDGSADQELKLYIFFFTLFYNNVFPSCFAVVWVTKQQDKQLALWGHTACFQAQWRDQINTNIRALTCCQHVSKQMFTPSQTTSFNLDFLECIASPHQYLKKCSFTKALNVFSCTCGEVKVSLILWNF